MIDLAPEQLAIVRRLLAAQVPECEVRAFGSRVLGKAKPHSDLDIALFGPVRLPLARLAALREAFQECELPIRVDVIDWHAISENFRNIIAAKFEILQPPALPDAESAKLEQAIKANLRGLGFSSH
jgi:predicted nucleotidyltransferase